MVAWVRCGTYSYRFLIFVFIHTFILDLCFGVVPCVLTYFGFILRRELVRPDFFLLVDLREFFFRSRVGGTKKNK